MALAARPLAGQGTSQAPLSTSCATPVVIDAGSLPYAGPGIDTRSLGAAPAPSGGAAGPTFPCDTKLVLPSGGQVPPSNVVWFSFTPAASDTYRIDTLGSLPADYDTILGVYTGACGSLVAVSGVCGRNGFFADDAPGSLQSSVTLNLTAGTTYTIAAGAIGTMSSYTGLAVPSAGGTLRLNAARVAVAYAYTYLLPSVSHSGGFASDLYVTNLEAADGQFVAQYLSHGNEGEQMMPVLQPVAPPQIVAANGTRFYPDILSLFGYSNDWGAMVLQSNRRLLVGARSWAAAPGGGTVGQYASAVEISPGLAAPEALAAGETGRFTALREDATARTNLLFANTSTVACTLEAEVRDGNGAVLGASRSIAIPPATAVQKNRLKDTFGIGADLRAVSVVVRNVTPGCSVAGVAYVIDGNTVAGTNDPYAVPLRK